jgi:uncharacterized membrane protein YphA (DoxX/SURF4 family)
MPPTMEITVTASRGKWRSRYLPAAARIVMGLPFVASGVAGLLGLTPPPPPSLPEGALAFASALIKTGYMMPLIFATQVVVGVLLLSNRFVPLALVLLAPFLVNALAFHVFLERSGLPIVLVMMALGLYLAWQYRAAYHSILAARHTPGAE